jgi:altronate hydrolase
MVLGLGCEANQALALIQNEGLNIISSDSIGFGERPQLPPILTIQEVGGIRKTALKGIEECVKLLRRANDCKRTTQPISELVVGTNCGGSDGNSGITANPALGVAGDELVRYGGTWLIAETSETYGAEHLLTRRAVTREVGEKLIEKIRWWEWYTSTLGAEINNNPAPGNKEGGLSTIYEKSLGAAAKGGTTPLVYVYDFAERIRHKGFCFMDTPGHDNPSVTGLVAGGCNVVVFTTGRGSCFGMKPSPSIKVATNSRLYHHMKDDMDIDAGVILDGVPIQDVGLQILNEIIDVASGRQTKSEAQGVGEEEFTPWVLGPIL